MRPELPHKAADAAKPALFVAREVFPDVLACLAQHFTLHLNPHDRTLDQAELIAALQGKAALFATPGEQISASVLRACPDLRMVGLMAVGYNNVDLAVATECGVMVSNTPDVLTETTADFAWALLLATARRVTESGHWLRGGHWQNWRYDAFLGMDVHGSTLGILGMGRIGAAIARRAAGFGMRVIYHNRSAPAALPPTISPDDVKEPPAKLHDAVKGGARAEALAKVPETAAAPDTPAWVDKATLLEQSDHLILMLPYSAATHHTIAAPELAQMKPGATLINLARGGVVDDVALIAALRSGHLFGAGLDVFENEPHLHPDFLTLTNVVLTPHIASASAATRRKMAMRAAHNLIAAWNGGTPPDLLNPACLTR